MPIKVNVRFLDLRKSAWRVALKPKATIRIAKNRTNTRIRPSFEPHPLHKHFNVL
jgi:hypothetical protein